MAYRRDIDGLRAVAVLAVVLFHAGTPGFSGGFVGVDVFFVISGFLITGIIAEDLAHGRFSIVTFYERRVRRIFPALFAMMAATGLAASVLYLPHETAELGRSAIAATLFVSNFYFHQTSDYFAGAAHLKPLLHTWSLAVEEQFYLAFPLLLWAIHRWHRGRWLLWLLPILAASFALAAWGAYARPQATFYLAPARIWELMAGALLALGVLPHASRRWQAEAAGVAGLAMTAGAVIGFSDGTVFPGIAAALPVAGACLLIWSGGRGATFATRLLSLRPMVFVGLVSYSLYLWHWPVLVLARQMAGGTLQPHEAALAVAVAGLIAVLSWRFIEQPVRRAGPRIARAPLFAAAAAAMTLAVGLGAIAHLSGGWPARYPDYASPMIAGREAMREGTCFLRPEQGPAAWPGREACRTGKADMRRVVLWGDSFAAHLIPGLTSPHPDTFALVQINASGCPPVLSARLPGRPHCSAFNRTALAEIEAERPDVVVIAARWEAVLGRRIGISDIQATIDRVRRIGADVIVVAQSPSFDFDSPYDTVYRSGRDTARVNFPLSLNASIARLERASVLDPMPLLCNGSICPMTGGGAFLYFDGGHLSTAGSRRLAETLAPLIERTLAARAGAISSASAAMPYGQ